MRIVRVGARNLRTLRSLDLELGPGLTVIHGPNESGKSTLIQAVELSLFGSDAADQGSAALRSHPRAGEEAPGDPAVRLELLDEETGRHWQVERSFGIGVHGAHFSVDGASIADPAEQQARLADALGIPGIRFFRSSAEAPQGRLAEIDRSGGPLRERLLAPVTGSDRRSRAVMQQLEEMLHALEDRDDGKIGRLAVAEEAVERIERAVANGDAALGRLVEDRAALVLAGERLAAARATVAEMRRLLEEARRAEALTAARDEALGRQRRYERAIELVEEIEDLESKHPSPTPLAVLRPTMARIRELQARIDVITEELGQPVDLTFDLGPEQGRFGGLGGLFGGKKRAQELRDEQIARRLRGRSNLEQELAERQAALEGELASLGYEDIASASDVLVAEEAHVASIERLTAELESLVGREPAEALPPLRDAARADVARRESELAQLEPSVREPGARERYEVEVRESEAEVEAAFAVEAAARGRVEASSVDAEVIAVEAERRAGWWRQLEELRRRARSGRLALEALQLAESATTKTATRYVEKLASADLARVTGGRWNAVRIEDGSLEIAARDAVSGAWVGSDALSASVGEIVHLVSRLAIVRTVTGDRRPPVLLDEPFAALDDERLAALLGLLHERAAELQVVILSASHRFDAFADRVVELPGALEADRRTGASAS